MGRLSLEVADIFRDFGAAWCEANAGHVSLGQFKVMSAIEACLTAALGGHVAACEACGHTHIAYNSCRNRHCPKCQGTAAQDWLSARAAELLPVPYYHIVFTLPAKIAGHGVEGPGQLLKLVTAFDLHPGLELAPGNAVGAFLELLERYQASANLSGRQQQYDPESGE